MMNNPCALKFVTEISTQDITSSLLSDVVI